MRLELCKQRGAGKKAAWLFMPAVIFALWCLSAIPAAAAGTDYGQKIEKPASIPSSLAPADRAVQFPGDVLHGNAIMYQGANPSGTVLYSNSTAIIVQDVYGLDSSASGLREDGDSTQTVAQGVYAEFEFGVRNNGNASDTPAIKISNLTVGGSTSAVWDFRAIDSNGLPLTWRSGNSSTSSDGDIATAAVITLPGAYATITLQVAALSGAGDGATLDFDVTMLTQDTPPGRVAGLYMGSNSSLYGGEVSRTASSKSVVVEDSSPPTVAITSPAPSSSVSGVIAISGSAYDLNFASYSVYYSPGDSPTAWRQVATSTTSVTSGSLATWNSGDLFGTYTIKLEAADTYGNVAQNTVVVRLDNSQTVAGTIPVDEWTMLSIPGLPKNADPHSFLGTGRYEVQQWDETLSEDEYLHKYRQSFALNVAGEGFWVKSYDAPISYSVDTWYTDSTAIYEISLVEGWNQLGSPFASSGGFAWDDVKVERSGVTKTMTEAIAAGWIGTSFHEYSSSGYTTHGLGESMVPGKAYFVKGIKAPDETSFITKKLLFDPGTGQPNGIARLASARSANLIVRPQYEWEIKLGAETETAVDNDNTAALMRGANDEYDKYDAAEPPTAKDDFVTLFFENDSWSRNAGRYTRDARPPAIDPSQPMEWGFSIVTSTPGSQVGVNVLPASNLPDNYTFLVRDEKTGEEFDPKTSTEYSYVDDGTGRRDFTLVARKAGDVQLVEKSHTFPSGWSLFSVPLEPEPTEVKSQLADDLEDIQVFQYFDRNVYEPGSAEHVDIQAGIGYWLHLDQETDLDFEGVTTDPEVPISVPLTKGWNLIGNPYEVDVNLGDGTQVQNGTQVMSLEDAIDAGWLAPKIFAYNTVTGGYDSYDAETLPMEPWRGYAVKALVPCTIIIKTGP